MPELPARASAPAPARAGKTRRSDTRGSQPATPSPGQAPARKGKNPARTSDPHAQREAERYAHPIASREAIAQLLADRGQLLTTEALAQELHLSSERDVEALTKRLAAMVRDGQLLQNCRGGYGVAKKLDLIAGTIIANAEGFGFLRPDDGAADKSEDLYLSPTEMRKVLHGDRVLASIIGVDRRGRKQGAICEVLERRVERAKALASALRCHPAVLVFPGWQIAA